MARYSAHSFASFGNAACTEDKPESRSSAAEILTFTFDTENPANSAISSNPTIGQAQAGHASINIALNGHYHDTTMRALVPTITISENATVSPASGVAIDLSEGKNVTYTVTAEDGTVNLYEISINSMSYSFEEWSTGKETGGIYEDTPIVVGWATCNDAVALIKNMQCLCRNERPYGNDAVRKHVLP